MVNSKIDESLSVLWLILLTCGAITLYVINDALLGELVLSDKDWWETLLGFILCYIGAYVSARKIVNHSNVTTPQRKIANIFKLLFGIPLYILGFGISIALIWYAIKSIFGAIAGTPGWAIVIIVLLILLLFK